MFTKIYEILEKLEFALISITFSCLIIFTTGFIVDNEDVRKLFNNDKPFMCNGNLIIKKSDGWKIKNNKFINDNIKGDISLMNCETTNNLKEIDMMLKYKPAEKYRGLYNSYIDNLVDIVNEKFTALERLDKELDENNIEDLKNFRKLDKELNKAFIDLTIEAEKSTLKYQQ